MIIINKISENKAVGQLSCLLASAYGVSPGIARQIGIAAALHDVGKQRLPAELLNLPRKLEPHEFEIIKTHTVLGAELLQSVQGSLGEMARNCCLWHHEWHNGGGYFGRRMDSLPFYLPFVAISDVFTALVSKRAYKEAWPPQEAMDYLADKAGTQFDPELVKVFLWLIQNDRRVPAVFRAADLGKVR
jgi:putative two-component system response regulator